MTRIFKGTRLGSDGVSAGRGVSGSEVWSESGIKSSVIGFSCLFCDGNVDKVRHP